MYMNVYPSIRHMILDAARTYGTIAMEAPVVFMAPTLPTNNRTSKARQAFVGLPGGLA